jgi:hypothetical protein
MLGNTTAQRHGDTEDMHFFVPLCRRGFVFHFYCYEALNGNRQNGTILESLLNILPPSWQIRLCSGKINQTIS